METLTYLIYGAGYWHSRWCSTGHDLPLLVFTILSCSWMVYEYGCYAYQNHKIVQHTPDSAYRTHSISCRDVFIECGLIYILSSIVAWWVPTYWVIVFMFLHSAKTTHGLNKAKSAENSHNEFLEGRTAIANLKKLDEYTKHLPHTEMKNTYLKIIRDLKA